MTDSSAAAKVALSASEKRRFLELINRFEKAKILVIGDFILDQFIWGTVDRISPEAPVPVVRVNRESHMPGGSLNAAHNVHALGGKVYPCGVLGRDLEGRMLLKVLRQHGIDTGGIVYDSKRPTSIKTRVIAHSQQVVRFDREKDDLISLEDCKSILKFVREKIKDVSAVVIEDYGKGVIQPGLLKEIVQLARKNRKPVIVDPKEKNFSYYQGVTVITPNRKEAYNGFEILGAGRGRKAGEKPSLEAVGRGLMKALKSEAVLMTLGEGGMALFEKNGSITRVPTAAQEVYDVSGAGDTVVATLALSIAAGAKMREAAILSNLAAGIVVGKLGTATVLPDELRRAVSKI